MRVSRSALVRNVARARAADPSAPVDLRRDACGAGLETVARAAVEAGVRSALLDDGADPLARERVAELGLAPSVEPALDPGAVLGVDGGGILAVSFSGPVLQAKRLRAGDGVSYGYRFRADRDTRAALVAGGYAQGVARALGGEAAVLLAGREMPIVGRVAMDVSVVLTGDAEVARGDEALFFGAEAPGLLADWARITGLTPLELVANACSHAAREVVA